MGRFAALARLGVELSEPQAAAPEQLAPEEITVRADKLREFFEAFEVLLEAAVDIYGDEIILPGLALLGGTFMAERFGDGPYNRALFVEQFNMAVDEAKRQADEAKKSAA